MTVYVGVRDSEGCGHVWVIRPKGATKFLALGPHDSFDWGPHQNCEGASCLAFELIRDAADTDAADALDDQFAREILATFNRYRFLISAGDVRRWVRTYPPSPAPEAA